MNESEIKNGDSVYVLPPLKHIDQYAKYRHKVGIVSDILPGCKLTTVDFDNGYQDVIPLDWLIKPIEMPDEPQILGFKDFVFLCVFSDDIFQKRIVLAQTEKEARILIYSDFTEDEKQKIDSIQLLRIED